MSKLIPALLAAATIGLGSTAYAQTNTAPSPSAAPTAPSTMPDTKAASPSGSRSGAATQPGSTATKTMTEADVRQELQKQGYTSVSDIKKKGDGFEAKAMKDGKRVSLAVDAKSGKVVTR